MGGALKAVGHNGLNGRGGGSFISRPRRGLTLIRVNEDDGCRIAKLVVGWLLLFFAIWQRVSERCRRARVCVFVRVCTWKCVCCAPSADRPSKAANRQSGLDG